MSIFQKLSHLTLTLTDFGGSVYFRLSTEETCEFQILPWVWILHPHLPTRLLALRNAQFFNNYKKYNKMILAVASITKH